MSSANKTAEGENVDDFAALEALMSKFDDKHSKPSTLPARDTRPPAPSSLAVGGTRGVSDFSQGGQGSQDGTSLHQGAELSEFDAIEAMMTSVESQFCPPQQTNCRSNSSLPRPVTIPPQRNTSLPGGYIPQSRPVNNSNSRANTAIREGNPYVHISTHEVCNTDVSENRTRQTQYLPAKRTSAHSGSRQSNSHL
jgi:hypothetical protein